MRMIENIGTDRVLGNALPKPSAGFTRRCGLRQDVALRVRRACSPTRNGRANAFAAFQPGAEACDAGPAPLAGGLLGDDSDRKQRCALQSRGLAVALFKRKPGYWRSRGEAVDSFE